MYVSVVTPLTRGLQSFSEIGDKGAKAIAAALPLNGSLEYLELVR
jgi:hypothetical protein